MTGCPCTCPVAANYDALRIDDASWYSDPQNLAQFRRFDGSDWTQHVSNGVAPAQPAAYQPQVAVGGQTTNSP